METRTPKDERGIADDCRSGRRRRRLGQECPCNKCLSRLTGIDCESSDISYRELNPGCTRTAGNDVLRVEPGNSTCKHIDADLPDKQGNPLVKCEEGGNSFSIFSRVQRKTGKLFSASKKCKAVLENLTAVPSSSAGYRQINHYSEWPVEVDARYQTVSGATQGIDQLYSFSPVEWNTLYPQIVSNATRDFQCDVQCHGNSNVSHSLGLLSSIQNRVCAEGQHNIANSGRLHSQVPKKHNAAAVQIEQAEPVFSNNEEIYSHFPGSELSHQLNRGIHNASSDVSNPSPLAASHGTVTSITSLLASAAYILPGTKAAFDMKPAKIGQLSPIPNRSSVIDRSNTHVAGVLHINMAQPAWLCGGECDVSAADYSRDGGNSGSGLSGKENNDTAVPGTRYNVDVTPRGNSAATKITVATPPHLATTPAERGTTATTLIQFSSTPEVRTSVDGSWRCSGCGVGGSGCSCCSRNAEKDSTDSQLTKHDVEVGDAENIINTDTSLHTDFQWTNHGACGTNIGHALVRDKNTQQKPIDLTPQQVRASTHSRLSATRELSKISLDSICSFHNENTVAVQAQWHGKYECGNISATQHRPPENIDGQVLEKPDRQQTFGSDPFLTDMNTEEETNSVVYANVANDNTSVSSAENEEQKSPACQCNSRGAEQILAVNPVDFHLNRLSHQYLNSSVTGQTYPDFISDRTTAKNHPDFLTDSESNYPYFFTDTGLVDCHQFDDSVNNSDMIFTATATKETSFTEKTPTTLTQPGELSPSSHHYYNKTAVFKPIAKELMCSSPNNCNGLHSEEKAFKSFFPINGNSNHGNTRDSELDLRLFPQLHCPLHRPSPLASPHQQLHQHLNLHQSHEQQQRLNYCHPHHQDNNFIRQQQQQQQPLYHHHRRSSTSSSGSLMHHIKCGPHYVRISPVSLLWTFLSVLVAGTCLLSFLTPYWTTHPDHIHSFGLFNLCVRDQRYSHPRPLCMNFGYQHYYSSTSLAPSNTIKNNLPDSSSNNDNNIHIVSQGDTSSVSGSSVDIARIPSGAWQAACLLFGAGVCLQILGALISLVVLALSEPWHHRVALINGYMQTVGVLLLVSGLLLYPVGFSSPFFSYYCDSTRAFCTGHCSMGWSYITAVMATALSIFCPVMSSFAEAQQFVRKPGAIVETAMA